jgi:flagellar biogenesis protein FliO
MCGLLVAALTCGSAGRAPAADMGGISQEASRLARAPDASSAPGTYQPAELHQPRSIAVPATDSRYAPAEPYPVQAASASADPSGPTATPASQPNHPARPLPFSPPTSAQRGDAQAGPTKPLVTGAASLGIVLGLFLLVVWVARRGTPGRSALVPSEAVEVLGRAPFVARQYVHIVRCGNKLLLVYFSQHGAQTLTEITDPAEVERLVGLCQGVSAAGPLRQLLQFGSRGRDRRYFARDRQVDLDFAHLDAMQRAAHEARG